MNEENNINTQNTEDEIHFDDPALESAWQWYAFCKAYLEATGDGKPEFEDARDEFRRLYGLPKWEYRLQDT